jgi:hypothetical protein
MRRDAIAAALVFSSSSSFLPSMAYHTRSVSVPSSPHSNETGIEEQLQSLKAATSSPSPTMEIMVDDLTKLGTIFSRIDELICFPNRKAVEGELDCSLVLLDLCDSVQESFAELKANVTETQLVLKRRRDRTAVHAKGSVLRTRVGQECAEAVQKNQQQGCF